MTNQRNHSGASRIDPRLLLRTLVYIASHSGVNSIELAEVMNMSSVSIKRLLGHIRKEFGVEITFRRDNTMLGKGEYTVENWGVFDQTKVFYFVKSQNENLPGYKHRR